MMKIDLERFKQCDFQGFPRKIATKMQVARESPHNDPKNSGLQKDRPVCPDKYVILCYMYTRPPLHDHQLFHLSLHKRSICIYL